MSQPLLQQQQQANQHAVAIFGDAVGDMDKIREQVEAAITQLTGQAMTSLAGNAYAGAMFTWLDEFGFIRQQLVDMSANLQDHTAYMLRTDATNAQQAVSFIQSQL